MPRSENELFERMKRLAQQKIISYLTHPFPIVRVTAAESLYLVYSALSEGTAVMNEHTEALLICENWQESLDQCKTWKEEIIRNWNF